MKKTPKRTINEVLNWETGENIDAEDFFKKSLEDLSIYRSELQKAIEGYRNPLFVCYYCKQKVRIRGGISKTAKRKVDIFHFAHLKDSEECHIKTKNKYTKEEVNRIKYNGEKESLLHRTLKEKIAESLRRNENTIGDVSKVEVEKVIKDNVISEWKKPDINAFHLKNRIAIELQLSTTWLDVITRRQHFYKEQRIFIFWIFHVFNVNDDIRKLTYNDVIYTNNQNAFVFNEETYELSKEANDLILKCYYKVYSNYDLKLYEEWKYSFVSLSQLKFDENRYCIYHHDSKKQKDLVLLEIEEKESKLLEKQRNKRIKEQQKREKLESLKSKLKSLNAELENTISKRNELNSKINELYQKIEKEEDFLVEIEMHTNETVLRFSTEKNYIRPFYNEDDLLENIKEKHKDHLINISQTNTILNDRIEILNMKIDAIDRLDIVKISGVNYQSLNKKNDWDYITKYFTQIQVIEKSDVHSLFAKSELKTISSQYELFRLQFSDTKLFLVDFSKKRNEFEIEVLKNKLKISDLITLKEKITEDIKKILIEFKKAKIKSIQSKANGISEDQNQLIDNIQDLENEINSVNQEIILAYRPSE